MTEFHYHEIRKYDWKHSFDLDFEDNDLWDFSERFVAALPLS